LAAIGGEGEATELSISEREEEKERAEHFQISIRIKRD
jgi:hypothetical protein